MPTACRATVYIKTSRGVGQIKVGTCQHTSIWGNLSPMLGEEVHVGKNFLLASRRGAETRGSRSLGRPPAAGDPTRASTL